MDPQIVATLYSLLGWMLFGICVLVGLVKTNALGIFHTLWAAVTVYFAVRLADSAALYAASFVAGPLGLKDVGGEIAGYWTVFLVVIVLSAIWFKLLGEIAMPLPPLLEQILSPLLGAAVGFLFALAVFQSAMTNDWMRTHFPGPMEKARQWMAQVDLSWFPHERVPPEEAERASHQSR